MVSERAALKIIRETLKQGPGEQVTIIEALGRVLKADVKAPDDFPPFSCSAFDGFAVRAEDTRTANDKNPVVMEISGLLTAGQMPQTAHKKGQAIRIMTGAPLPSKADAVVKQEDVEAEGERIYLRRSVKKGEGVRPKGYEAKKGERVARKGCSIGPEEIGFLASLGVEKVEVFTRPSVALLMIGDELVAPGTHLSPGKIFAGNTLMLNSLVKRYGGRPINMGIVADSEEKIARAVQKAAKAEMALAVGGSGGGVHDLTAKSFLSVGGRFLFQGVSIWPGSTLSFGLFDDTPFFILPGGPRTSSLCFHIFVREALRVFCPTERNFSVQLNATMLNSLYGRAGVTNYLHVSLRKGKSGYYAVSSRVAPPPESRCALAVLPPGTTRVKKGDEVKIILL
jgi:molybdopterin molybdotransferase